MALYQFVLLEDLDAPPGADAAGRIKRAAGAICHAFIDAELTAVLGAGVPGHQRGPGDLSMIPNRLPHNMFRCGWR
jgi:hypothetical protein